MNDRHIWVDYARGIGILLVVYGHVARGVFNAGMLPDAYSFGLVDSVIYSFHMPLFFFLAGIFFFDSLQKYGAAGLIREKLASVAYPYLVWSLLQGGIEAALSAYTNTHTGMGEVLSLLWRPRAQFWFLYVLFLVYVLAALAGRPRVVRLPLVPLAATLAYLLNLYVRLPFPLDYLANYFFYFSLGTAGIAAFAPTYNRRGAGLAACAALFGALAYLFHVRLGLRYTDVSLLVPLLALSGIGLLCSAALCLEKAALLPWLATLGRLSMPVYLMHVLAASGSRIALSKVAHIDNAAIHIGVGMLAGVLLPLALYRCASTQRLAWLQWLFRPAARKS